VVRNSLSQPHFGAFLGTCLLRKNHPRNPLMRVLPLKRNPPEGVNHLKRNSHPRRNLLVRHLLRVVVRVPDVYP
jgi:hypothetical protein